MTDKVGHDGPPMRSMRAQYTTYSIDTDHIGTLPEICTRIPPPPPVSERNEEQYSSSLDSTTNEPIYESALVTKTTNSLPRISTDKAVANSPPAPTTTRSGRKGPRVKTNDIYERSCDSSQINGMYSGYSYVPSRNYSDSVSVASTVNEQPLSIISTPLPQEGALFAWTNPIAIKDDGDDSDYAEIPSKAARENVYATTRETRPRSRVNDAYDWTTYNAAEVFRHIDEPNKKGGRKKTRVGQRNSRNTCKTWFPIFLALAALGIACYALYQTQKIITESKSEARSSARSDNIQSNISHPGNEESDENASEAPEPDTSIHYKAMKQQLDALSKNYSKLLEQYQGMRQEDSLISQKVENMKVQLTESNLRHSKTNASLWNKLNNLKLPQGPNGTKGETGARGPAGPQGPPGPRGLSVTNCTYATKSDSSWDGTALDFYVMITETQTEKLFDVSCTTDQKTFTVSLSRLSTQRYQCICIAPEIHTLTSATCTIRYVTCQLP